MLRLEECDKVKDGASLAELLNKHYPDVPYPATKESIVQGKIVFFKVFDGNVQVGITGYAPKTPSLVETVKTVIFPQFRAKGFGVQVSQMIEDECKRVGFKKVMSTIYATNISMIQIKLRQGYTIEGYHPDHEAPGFHEYSLGKIL